MHIKNFDPFYFNKKNINGVPVYYKNIPWAPCIHVNIIFHTGALSDPLGKEGVAHFMEHVTLKGSPKFPNERDWRSWRKKYTFMTSNAFTSLNAIYYPFKCVPKNYEKVMLDIKDIIFNSFLRDEDVSSERNVILQEAWNIYSNEKYLKYLKNLRKNLYKDHPNERFSSPLGYPDSIKKITTKDVLDYYKNNFGIGNFSIVLAGNINNKNVDFIKEFTKDLPILKIRKIKDKKYKIKKPQIKNIKFESNDLGLEKEQVEINILRVKEKLLNEKEIRISILSRNVLQEVLTDKFRVEHKLCYGINTSTNVNKNHFLFSINIKTQEKNIDLVISEFKNIIKNFNSKIYKQNFEERKILNKENLQTSEFLSEDIINEARNRLINDREMISLKENLKIIESVEFKDVQKFIKSIFGDESKYYTEIILPTKKEEKNIKFKNAKN